MDATSLPRRRPARSQRAATRSATSPAAPQFFADSHPAGTAAPKMAPLRAPPRADQRASTSSARRGGPGRRAGAHAQGRAEQLLHDPQPDQVEPDDEPVLRRRQGPLQGRADRRRASPTTERGRAARRAAAVKVDYEELPAGLRRRGGAEARRAAGQRVPRPRTTSSTRATTAGACASATSRRASPRPTTSSRSATSPRRSSMRRPRRPAASSCPRRNGRLTCYSNTQALFFTLDNTALILDVPFQQAAARRRHGRRRLRRQGRRDRRADRAASPRCSPTGRSSSSTAARRRCRSPRRARPSASTSRTA